MIKQNLLRDILLLSRDKIKCGMFSMDHGKNHPEMKASFLFNILGTIANNLRALTEFALM